MSEVRIKTDEGKYITVSVSKPECPSYKCFGYHRFQHRGAAGKSGSVCSGLDSFYSCPHRNYHGCPMNPEKKEGVKGDKYFYWDWDKKDVKRLKWTRGKYIGVVGYNIVGAELHGFQDSLEIGRAHV